MKNDLDKPDDLGAEELLSWTIRQSLGAAPSPAEYAAWLKGEPRRRRSRPWLILALVGGTTGLATAAFNSIDLIRDQSVIRVADEGGLPPRYRFRLSPDPTDLFGRGQAGRPSMQERIAGLRGRLQGLPESAYAYHPEPNLLVAAELLSGEVIRELAPQPAPALERSIAAVIDQRVAEGRSHLAAKRFAEAEAFFLNAFGYQPTRLSALEQAGSCAIKKGQLEVGFGRYRAVIEADPSRADAAFYAAFGMALGFSGEAEGDRLAEARRLLEPIWRERWEHPARDLSQAIAAAELGEDLSYQIRLIELAELLTDRFSGLEGLARAAADEAGKRARKRRLRYRSRPKARRRNGKIERPAPGDEWYAHNLAEALRVGENSKAVEYAEEWYRSDLRAESARLGLARAHRAAGAMDQAARYYGMLTLKRGIGQDPFAEHAACLLSKGGPEAESAARALLYRIVVSPRHLAPGEAPAAGLAYLYEALDSSATNSPEERARLLELFLKKAPASHPLRSFAAMRRHGLKGERAGPRLAVTATGLTDLPSLQALPETELLAFTDTLAWCLESAPKDKGLRVLLGRGLERQGRLAEAFHVYQGKESGDGAPSIAPADPGREAVYRRALIAFGFGLFQEAWTSLSAIKREGSPIGLACAALSRQDNAASIDLLRAFLAEPGPDADFAPRARAFLAALEASPPTPLPRAVVIELDEAGAIRIDGGDLVPSEQLSLALRRFSNLRGPEQELVLEHPGDESSSGLLKVLALIERYGLPKPSMVSTGEPGGE